MKKKVVTFIKRNRAAIVVVAAVGIATTLVLKRIDQSDAYTMFGLEALLDGLLSAEGHNDAVEV